MREKELEYALLLMVYQYCTDHGVVFHNFMSAGEEAFRVLGIENCTSCDEIWKRIEELEHEDIADDEDLQHVGYTEEQLGRNK